MSYLRPEEVLSPRSHVGGVLEVIHDPGENRMSVARILYDKTEWIAARWNGNDEQPLGSPVVRGHPTWLLVDSYLAGEVEAAARRAAEHSPNSLISKYREMAQDAPREDEAAEWIEALRDDVPAQR